ncbi:MAG: hypothetical protein ABFR90_11170 [Planctomycetota bacterium]
MSKGFLEIREKNAKNTYRTRGCFEIALKFIRRYYGFKPVDKSVCQRRHSYAAVVNFLITTLKNSERLIDRAIVSP